MTLSPYVCQYPIVSIFYVEAFGISLDVLWQSLIVEAFWKSFGCFFGCYPYFLILCSGVLCILVVVYVQFFYPLPYCLLFGILCLSPARGVDLKVPQGQVIVFTMHWVFLEFLFICSWMDLILYSSVFTLRGRLLHHCMYLICIFWK